jgi:16S rRNA (adenine1518-N6/adenine1519-N6)-dimethyltransferase
MQTLGEIKSILEAIGATPKRSLGQNFLVDHNLIRKLVDSAGVVKGDVVLEVGPGTGTMTEELLDRGAVVVACEMDDGLAGMLHERMPERLAKRGLPSTNFTLVHGDCLEGKHAVNPRLLAAIQERTGDPASVGAFKLVANLPYGAGTPLMSALLVAHPACELLAVTIQREVADRLLAGPGSKDYGPIGVIAQALCELQRVATCGPECFWPRPEVTSAMVCLRRRARPMTDDPRRLSAACRVLFSQRRKQIGGLIGKLVNLETLSQQPGCGGITSTMRAEQLTIEQIVALSRLPGIADAGDEP